MGSRTMSVESGTLEQKQGRRGEREVTLKSTGVWRPRKLVVYLFFQVCTVLSMVPTNAPGHGMAYYLAEVDRCTCYTNGSGREPEPVN